MADRPIPGGDTPAQRIVNPLCERETINALRRQFGFAFNKGLGQNFLVNPRIPWQIVQEADIDASWGVLEIGPGIGCLTYELAQHAGRVAAVEIDAALLPILEQTLPFDNVHVVHADFMKLDLADWVCRQFGDRPVAVVANLPYYITTPILMRLLEQAPPQLRRIVVMVQREVAVRLCAPSGSPEGGAISLAVEYRSLPRILFRVPPGCFMPAPKVESAVVRMDLRTSPAVSCSNPDAMFRLIRQGFGQRRKTLVNALGNQGPFSKALLGDALDALHLARDIRAERMTLAQFAALTDFLLNHACPDGGAVL